MISLGHHYPVVAIFPGAKSLKRRVEKNIYDPDKKDEYVERFHEISEENQPDP